MQFEGYTIDKKRIAYYAFGDKTRHNEVDDFLCEDAVGLLNANLEVIKSGLSNSVVKTEPTIRNAIVFYAACLIVKSGNSVQKSGNITSENMGDKGVSYESLKGTDAMSKTSKDWCSLAHGQLKLYATKYKFGNLSKLGYVSISNYRGKLLHNVYNKHTEDFKYGGKRVPQF